MYRGVVVSMYRGFVVYGECEGGSAFLVGYTLLA